MAGTGQTKKRPAHGGPDGSKSKRHKRQWGSARAQKSKGVVENGDRGIFVTCERGKEQKCAAEILDILAQDTQNQSDAEPRSTGQATSGNDEEDDDIEAQIKRELEGMKPGESKAPFQVVYLDIPCLIFVKLNDSLDPVQYVHNLCRDAQKNPQKPRCRWIKRLTPMTTMRKLLGGGLEQVAAQVLKPHFHSGQTSKKFAIRPTSRNSSQLSRDTVIKTVAEVVGPNHSVDLTNYDLLILVDVVLNFCGMSVVGRDYDELKRYNLAEIYHPTPRKQATGEATKESEAVEAEKSLSAAG